jgi:hypothetical protein
MDIKEQFDKLIEDTPFTLPLKYFGNLLSLTGVVYEIGKDENMDAELTTLSNYVRYLVELNEFEDIINKLVPDSMDNRSMFNAGFERYRENQFPNLTHVTINFPKSVSIKENKSGVSDRLIDGALEKFKAENSYNFNTTKIIAWIKTKIK